MNVTQGPQESRTPPSLFLRHLAKMSKITVTILSLGDKTWYSEISMYVMNMRHIVPNTRGAQLAQMGIADKLTTHMLSQLHGEQAKGQVGQHSVGSWGHSYKHGLCILAA